MRKMFQTMVFMTAFLCGVPATAEPGPDLAFVKQEPFRKAKQALDTSSITTAHDARVIGEAITPVMRLLVALTYAKFPESVNKEVLTDHGRAVLRQPPLRNEKKRLSIASVGAWKVCGDEMLSFTATYHDLFRKNPWTANFLFKKVDGIWRFHDHAEISAGEVCR
jgi:hypothetical protein